MWVLGKKQGAAPYTLALRSRASAPDTLTAGGGHWGRPVLNAAHSFLRVVLSNR